MEGSANKFHVTSKHYGAIYRLDNDAARAADAFFLMEPSEWIEPSIFGPVVRRRRAPFFSLKLNNPPRKLPRIDELLKLPRPRVLMPLAFRSTLGSFSFPDPVNSFNNET